MAVESPGAFMQGSAYGAEITRRTIENLLQRGGSIGSVTGGLVNAADCEIVAGPTMHVKVEPGEMWVPGTTSSAQSGYYCRVSSQTELSIAASDPTNPRIDRVSAVVKDKAYTGSEESFTLAVETGTAESGATLANLKGVAAAPTSSGTLGYVLVPAKATTISAAEVQKVMLPVALGISQLPLARTSSSETAKPNQVLAIVATGQTITLPFPATGVQVVLLSGPAFTTTVTASSGKIYGDFTSAATTVTLLGLQHLWLVGDGLNWDIIAGEPHNENKYAAGKLVAAATPETPSATRDTAVSLEIVVNAGAVTGNIKVGGVEITAWENNSGGVQLKLPFAFICPAGQAWEWKKTLGTSEVFASYLGR